MLLISEHSESEALQLAQLSLGEASLLLLPRPHTVHSDLARNPRVAQGAWHQRIAANPVVKVPLTRVQPSASHPRRSERISCRCWQTEAPRMNVTSSLSLCLPSPARSCSVVAPRSRLAATAMTCVCTASSSWHGTGRLSHPGPLPSAICPLPLFPLPSLLFSSPPPLLSSLHLILLTQPHNPPASCPADHAPIAHCRHGSADCRSPALLCDFRSSLRPSDGFGTSPLARPACSPAGPRRNCYSAMQAGAGPARALACCAEVRIPYSPVASCASFHGREIRRYRYACAAG